MPAAEQTCANCANFNHNPLGTNEAEGWCCAEGPKLNPGIVVGALRPSEAFGCWPRVSQGWWCRRWEKKSPRGSRGLKLRQPHSRRHADVERPEP